jgi:hypothetical protein
MASSNDGPKDDHDHDHARTSDADLALVSRALFDFSDLRIVVFWVLVPTRRVTSTPWGMQENTPQMPHPAFPLPLFPPPQLPFKISLT